MPGSDDNSDDRQLLLERLSFDGTISRVFTIYFRLFETVTGLSFLVLLVPIAFISFYFMKMLQDELGLDMSQVQIDPTYAMNHISEIFVYSFLKPMPLVPFEWIVEACTIHAVAALYLGNRNVSMSECFMGVIKRMLSFIALTVIVSLIVGVSYLALIVPGMWLSVRLFVVGPAFIIEKSGGIKASIERSFELVKGSWCYVFCVAFVVILLQFPGQMIFGALIQAMFGDPETSSLACFGDLLYLVLLSPITAICETVMYFNLRVEKEGLNHTVLMNDFRGDESDQPYEPLITDEEEEITEDAVGEETV